MLSRFLLSLILVLMVACQKPLEAPELVDPVYLGLKGQIKEFESSVKEEEALLTDLEAQLSALEPQSNLRGKLLEKISVSRTRLLRSQQMVKYFMIRARSRKIYVHKIYPKYFESATPWPDPTLKSQYETHKRLLASPRQWDSRVPKLNQSGLAGVDERKGESAPAGSTEQPKAEQ